MFPGIDVRPGAPGGQNALQGRPRRGHHEGTGQVGDGREHRPGVFLPRRFPGDNHRAGLDLFRADPGAVILPGDEIPDGRGIQGIGVQKGREVDGASVENLPLGNLHAGHREGRGGIFQGQTGVDELGGGGAQVDSHRLERLAHGATAFITC